MKFWPSALVALSPWRAMTSRSGGSSRRASPLTPPRRAAGRTLPPCGSPRPSRRGSAQVLAGDVERGAVVGRGADDRQAERDVDAIVEVQRLQRDQRLVVVHAQRRVVARARRGLEHGVGGVRAGDVEPSSRSRSIAGTMISISSRPSAPPSPAWGLSPATASRGCGDAELRCRPARRRGPRRRSGRSVSASGTSGEREMGGDRDGAQGRPGEHHRVSSPRHAAALGDEFGLAGMG